MSKLEAREYESFESIKQVAEDGLEFWFARDLQRVLQYVQWRNFQATMDRAMLACKNSGFNVADHFADVSKMVRIGSGAVKPTIDYRLTRYACYLIAQNGDPKKEGIALAQSYFALQTRKQEFIEERMRVTPTPRPSVRTPCRYAWSGGTAGD